MDSRLSAKLVSIFLVLSVCTFGYVISSTLGSPTPTAGLVAIDKGTLFNQTDATTYQFPNDVYLHKLVLTSTYISFNDSVRLSVTPSSGHLNVTLIDWDWTDGVIEVHTQQLYAHTDITVTVSGLTNMGIYAVFVNGTRMGTTAVWETSITYQYSSTQEYKDFKIVMVNHSKPINAIIVIIILMVLLAAIILVVYMVVKHAQEGNLTTMGMVFAAIGVIILLTFLGVIYSIVG